MLRALAHLQQENGYEQKCRRHGGAFTVNHVGPSNG